MQATLRPRVLLLANTVTRTFLSSKVVAIVDYFQLLGIRKTFDLSPEQLKDTYKDFMKKLHPDLHTLKSNDEKIVKADQASQITAAYQVLLDPHSRALHLLELLGSPMNEQTTVCNNKTDIHRHHEFFVLFILFNNIDRVQ